MKVNEYLTKYSLTYRDMAKKMWVCPSAVLKWVKGSKPRRKMAERINKRTEGEIGMEDLGW